MAEPQKVHKQHKLHIDNREKLTATGIKKVDFFSDELITAQTELGQLNIKGAALRIENLSAESGDMLVLGNIMALSYSEGKGESDTFFSRLFK